MTRLITLILTTLALTACASPTTTEKEEPVMSITKPTDYLHWAEDANFSAPGEPWDGQPTKALPSAGERQQGWEPTEEPGAEAINASLNLLDQWVQWLAGDTALVDPVLGIPAGGTSPEWELDDFSFVGMKSIVDDGKLFIPLNRLVPRGAQITAYRLLVEPGAARGVGNRMVARIRRYSVDFSTPSVGASGTPGSTATDDGTSSLQTIEDTGLTVDLDGTYVVGLEIIAGDDGGSHNADKLHAIEVDYSLDNTP